MSESFIKQQTEVRANLVSQMREVIDSAEERGGLNAEELQKVERIEQDLARADESIAVAQRNAERSDEARAAAGEFMPVESVNTDGDIFRALARGDIREHNFGAWDKRATLVPSVNTVRVDFLDQVMSLARLVGPMLDVSTVYSRESGESLRIPTLTAYSTAAQYAAGSAISDDEPTMSSVLLEPKKQAFIIKVASELASDASFPLESLLVEQAGNAIGTRVNSLATVGTGSGETEGVVTAAASAVEASATAISADDLIELYYSLDGAARQLGASFMANGSTIAEIRKLKDGSGRYLYDPVTAGQQTVLGVPLLENPAMDDIGTGNRPIVAGYLPSYALLTTGLVTAISTDAFFANDEIGYRFTYRFDGKLTHDAHVKAIVNA